MTRFGIGIAASFLVLVSTCATGVEKRNSTDSASSEPAMHGPKILRNGLFYPREMVLKGKQGCVIVAFDLDAAGKADNFQVLDSQPPGAFDIAAMQGLAKSVYQPGQAEGRYAKDVVYTLEGDIFESFTPCIAVPTYDQLNPKK